MNVLALIHGDDVHSGVFRESVGNHGHLLEEWSTAWGRPLPRPLDDYDAVFVLGGAMHADQDERHPWLREETMLLQGLLDRGVPLLGVCLGAQMVARAAHAAVYPSPSPEIGWFDVELTGDAADDPVLSVLPPRFEAFQWHSYTYDLPAGAVELARSPVCTQAYRLGEARLGRPVPPGGDRRPGRVVDRRPGRPSPGRGRAAGGDRGADRGLERDGARALLGLPAGRSPRFRPAGRRGATTRATSRRSCARGSPRRSRICAAICDREPEWQ